MSHHEQIKNPAHPKHIYCRACFSNAEKMKNSDICAYCKACYESISELSIKNTYSDLLVHKSGDKSIISERKTCNFCNKNKQCVDLYNNKCGEDKNCINLCDDHSYCKSCLKSYNRDILSTDKCQKCITMYENLCRKCFLVFSPSKIIKNPRCMYNHCYCSECFIELTTRRDKDFCSYCERIYRISLRRYDC